MIGGSGAGPEDAGGFFDRLAARFQVVDGELIIEIDDVSGARCQSDNIADTTVSIHRDSTSGIRPSVLFELLEVGDVAEIHGNLDQPVQ